MDVRVRLDVLVERVGAGRIVQALTLLERVRRLDDVDHVEQLLPEVPGGFAGLRARLGGVVLGRRGVERHDETLGADAVAERFEVLGAALLVNAA